MLVEAGGTALGGGLGLACVVAVIGALFVLLTDSRERLQSHASSGTVCGDEQGKDDFVSQYCMRD